MKFFCIKLEVCFWMLLQENTHTFNLFSLFVDKLYMTKICIKEIFSKVILWFNLLNINLKKSYRMIIKYKKVLFSYSQNTPKTFFTELSFTKTKRLKFPQGWSLNECVYVWLLQLCQHYLLVS